MAITITYRFMGVDVAANAPNIDYIQWDSDVVAFDTTTSQVDVVWAGVPTHYYPYLDGAHTPNVTYYTQFRMSVANGGGGTVTTLVAHALNGDILANGNVGFVVSSTPTDSTNPFGQNGGSGGISAGLGPLSSDFIGPTQELVFVVNAAFAAGGRGILISVPTVGQWQMQKLAIRPAKQENQ